MCVEVTHLLTPPTPPADGTYVWSVANGLPAGFQPLITTGRFPCYYTGGSAAAEQPSLEIETNGSILVYGVNGLAITRLDATMIFSTV